MQVSFAAHRGLIGTHASLSHWRRAAEGGLAEAHYKLGAAYDAEARTPGVLPDDVAALRSLLPWICVSFALG